MDYTRQKRWVKGFWVKDRGQIVQVADMRTAHLDRLISALRVKGGGRPKCMTKCDEFKQEMGRRERGESKEPVDKRYMPGMWLTKDGDHVKLSSMSDEHLKNVARHLQLYGGFYLQQKTEKLLEVCRELDFRANPPAPPPPAPPAPPLPQTMPTATSATVVVVAQSS